MNGKAQKPLSNVDKTRKETYRSANVPDQTDITKLSWQRNRFVQHVLCPFLSLGVRILSWNVSQSVVHPVGLSVD
jgi:hypothetical protein